MGAGQASFSLLLAFSQAGWAETRRLGKHSFSHLMSSSGAPGCRQSRWNNVIPGRELKLREWRDLTKSSLLVSAVGWGGSSEHVF